MVEWRFATQVAGAGFLAVLVVLVILSLVLWPVSLLIYKVTSRLGKGR